VAEVVGLDPADPTAVAEVCGQVAVATTSGVVSSVSLRPREPAACEAALAAVRDADWVVLGPGSWFTSVLPHLLVPDLRRALVETSARRLVCLNLAEQVGETDGFSPEAHLDVLAAHAPELVLDVVLADASAVGDPHGLMAALASSGGRLVLAPVARDDGTPRHDSDLLADALGGAFLDAPPTPSNSPTEAPAWR